MGGAPSMRAERFSGALRGNCARPVQDASDPSRHYVKLMRFVRGRFRVGDEAQDIVQDAYARLAQAAEKAPIRDSVAFLRVAATNLVRDRARSSLVRRMTEAEHASTDAIACPAPSAERVVAARQRLAVMDRALEELPVKRRAALVLHRFDNLSHAEIAERLGISISMVEKHIRCGLAHCRARLEEADGEQRP